MLRIKKVFTRIHISLWLLFSLLVGFQLSQDTPDWFRVTIGFIMTCIYVFYGHFILLTGYSGKKKGRNYYIKLAIAVFTAPILFMITHNGRPTGWDPILGHYLVALLTIVPIFLFLSWLARITENLVLNTIRKEQLENQAVQSELHYLKSQINPHFLFNTLNNIHTLVYKKAETAPEAVLRLASLMRYMIYESNAHTVLLSREIDYLKDYIALQQFRYKADPVVDLMIEGIDGSSYIAPLLFIHFLENAYKHAPARMEPLDIKVKVLIKDNALKFSIQNPTAKNQNTDFDEPGGIGLPNIRKRLQLLYPDKHTLEISDYGDRYCVTLTIHDTSSIS